jgi:predicted MFS family arabinose efflux permease
MGGSINWTYSDVLLQRNVEDQFLGRVFAFNFAFFTLAMALSVWLSGLILDNTGITSRQLAYLLSAASLLPLLPWIWTSRTTRQPVSKP